VLGSIGSLGRNGGTAAVEFIDVKNVRFTGTTNGARIKTWEVNPAPKKNMIFFLSM
jgi:hypothetical protein